MMTFNRDEVDVWITSDTHYSHKNICLGTTEWPTEGSKSGFRDFDTLQEMNQALVDGINKNVKFNDVLIHLGDWSFGGIDKIWKFRKQINCQNIYHVYGNHDHHISSNKVMLNCHKDVLGTIVDGSVDGNVVYAKDLFRYSDHVLDFKVKSNKTSIEFFASHYAHRVWNQHHKGRFHVYGHSHTSLEYQPYGRSMDVGVDNAFRLLEEYRPFHIDEVFDLLSARPIFNVDHHDSNTN